MHVTESWGPHLEILIGFGEKPRKQSEGDSGAAGAGIAG